MGLAKELVGARGMLASGGLGDDGAEDADMAMLGGGGDIWSHGFLFAPALTIGGGTSEVQRNIIGERVLGLPHDVDVEVGKDWSEARLTPTR
jgi:alkylation response protein AidB-like acyl-CoA dehydrogenase